MSVYYAYLWKTHPMVNYVITTQLCHSEFTVVIEIKPGQCEGKSTDFPHRTEGVLKDLPGESNSRTIMW